MPKCIDLSWQKFGRWFVICRFGKTKSGSYRWISVCECGTVKVVNSPDLVQRKSLSCGCYNQELQSRLRQLEHAQGRGRGIISRGYKCPERDAWRNAQRRCNNPSDAGYKNYGGRGIEFRFISYEEFLSCLGRRPSSEYSLDRSNNDGHYEPGNVRWATWDQQLANRREYRCRKA